MNAINKLTGKKVLITAGAQGISEGTKLEWAGIQTLWTLKVLKNYGRIKE